MLRLIVQFVLLASLASTIHASQSLAMKDLQLGSRALTDADMEKYVAILAKVTQANKERKGATSPAALNEVTAKRAKACEEQGWTSIDYGVVDSRMMAAGMHIRMEKTLPVPDDKKADVAIARKFEARIAAAKK